MLEKIKSLAEKYYGKIFTTDKTHLRNVRKIIIHHTAGPKTMTVEEIRRFHVEKRKYRDIGYHALIDQAGIIHMGRPINLQGAHCSGQNHDSLGISLIGYYHPPVNDTITEQQMDALTRLCAFWCQLYGLPASAIWPHQKFGRTACPGNHVIGRMNDIRWGTDAKTKLLSEQPDMFDIKMKTRR